MPDAAPLGPRPRAETPVMSLWKVADEQTQELIVDFYRRLMAGEGRAEALRSATGDEGEVPDPTTGCLHLPGGAGPLSTLSHPLGPTAGVSG